MSCFLNVSLYVMFVVFFFKQKTAYEIRISDWSSDVCSSDLPFYKSPHQARETDIPMMRGYKRLRCSDKGATAVEYGLICALIVLAAMGAIKGFGEKVITMWDDVADQVTNP